MRLRYWLSDVFREEATGAGEGAGGTTAEASPHAEKLAEWVAERSGAEDTPITTEATATTAEPLDKEIPVETTSTDAVGDNDAGSKDAEETGLDPLLMELVEAYEYTPEDVKGFDNDGLKRLLAREHRRRGNVAPAAETTKLADAPAADTTSARQAPAAEADTKVVPAVATFADVQATLEEKLSEEGLGDAAIAREVKLAKFRWEREETILIDARQARAEAEGMRQEMSRRETEHHRQLEVNSLLDVADQFARDGLSILGAPDAVWNEAQQAARMKFVQAYDTLKTMHPDVPLKKLAPVAIDIAFHDEIQKRDAKSYARSILKQANRVLDSGTPSKASQQDDGSRRDWLKNPKIARIARKHQINVG